MTDTGGIPRPFLRWAGGKQKIAKQLAKFAPPVSSYRRYYEPFLGGGALFFAIRPRQATLSDVNSSLVNCYQEVARNHCAVARLVMRYANSDCPDFYYHLRAQPLGVMKPIQRAAAFIYLNKAAFNGIYRVNKQGHFNVPYGPSIRGPAVPSASELRLAAHCLRRSRIVSEDFERAVSRAQKGAFVYLDPPYPPRSDTAFFTHYCEDRFGWHEQVRVARVFAELDARGCLVMLSNAWRARIIDLYKGFHTFRVDALRWVGSNGDRFGVREAVITNYDPRELKGS